MGFVLSDKVAQPMLDALGIDIKQLISVSLNLAAGEVPKLTLERVLTEDECRHLTEVFQLFRAAPFLDYHPEEENLHG